MHSVSLMKLCSRKSVGFIITTFAISGCGGGGQTGYHCTQDTGFIKLETWITKTSSTGGKASARFEWLKIPNYELTDIFAIGLNSYFSPVPGTESAVYKYDEMATGKIITKNLTDTTRGDGGYGYRFKLMKHSLVDNHHRGYMEYQYIRNNTTALLADAFSSYAHQETSFSVDSPTFLIPVGGGLTLSQASKFSTMTGQASIKW